MHFLGKKIESENSITAKIDNQNKFKIKYDNIICHSKTQRNTNIQGKLFVNGSAWFKVKFSEVAR